MLLDVQKTEKTKMKWLHTFGSIGAFLLTVFTPTIQTAVMGHPAISMGLAAAYAILGQFVPHTEPKTQTQSQIQPQSKSLI